MSSLEGNFIKIMQIELNLLIDIVLFLENYHDAHYGIEPLDSIEHLIIELQVVAVWNLEWTFNKERRKES